MFADNDLSGGAKKKMRVLNLKNYPVVVNDAGQTVPGQQIAVVAKTDETANSCIRAGLVRLID